MMVMRVKEVVSYTASIAGSDGITWAHIVVVVFSISDRRSIMRFGFPAVTSVENVLNDFFCRVLIWLPTPRSSENASVQVLELSGVARLRQVGDRGSYCYKLSAAGNDMERIHSTYAQRRPLLPRS